MDIKELVSHYAEYAGESQEYQKNEEFNRRLDEGEIEGYELVFRNPSGGEQRVAPLSAALFVADFPTYRQLVRDDMVLKRREVLNLDAFPSNEQAYDRLLSLVTQQAAVIPFVGAGFSVAAGCPSWSDYILEQAVRSGLDRGDVKQRLKAGEHEVLMDEVIQRLTLNVFQRDFSSQFEGGRISPALSPSSEMVSLFDGCYITTNFDRVLEKAHQEKRPFEEKVVGRDDTGRFLKAIHRSAKYLLKLHGNIDEQRDRILTLAEYNSGYGNSSIDYSLPIPRTLKRVFGSFTVMFVGCSLIADRYLEVLRDTFNRESSMMPDHFAILDAPDDEDERMERDRFLAGHGITPIWFEHGQWDRPAEIIQLLKLEK